jgi:hypothetical protein
MSEAGFRSWTAGNWKITACECYRVVKDEFDRLLS